MLLLLDGCTRWCKLLSKLHTAATCRVVHATGWAMPLAERLVTHTSRSVGLPLELADDAVNHAMQLGPMRALIVPLLRLLGSPLCIGGIWVGRRDTGTLSEQALIHDAVAVLRYARDCSTRFDARSSAHRTWHES